MIWLRRFLARCRATLWNTDVDADMEEEIRLHLEHRTLENVSAGMSLEEAKAAAERKFGAVDEVRNRARAERRWSDRGPLIVAQRSAWRVGLDKAILALTQGTRALRRSPAFLVTSVLVLGVSLGNQIAISSLVDSLLLAPPTSARPEELTFITSKLTNGYVSYPDYLDLKERNQSFSGLFGFATYRTAGLVARETFQTVSCTGVGGAYFATLGVRPAEGRLIEESDDTVAAESVAVLTFEMYERLGVQMGELVRINNEAFRVIGVLPKDFRPIERGRVVGVWLPLSKVTPFRLAQHLTMRGFQWVKLGGRLKPGVTIERANAELKILADALAKENARVNYGMDLYAQTYTKSRLAEGGNSRTILLLYSIAWLLLGLAFVNFAALTVLRLLARRRELAIRMSVGATRGDVSWPLLVELLSVCALAVGFGYCFAHLLFSLFKLDPGLASVVTSVGDKITGRAIATVVIAVVLCGVGVWAVAMRHAYRSNLTAAGREGFSAPHRQWGALSLYAVQFAIVFCLSVVALTIVGELREIQQRVLPFRTDKVLMADVNASVLGLAANRAAREKFLDSCLEAIRSAPGVIAAGGRGAAPLFTPGSANIIVNGEDPSTVPDKNFSHYGPVTAGYFEALGLRVVDGRALTDFDFASAAKVVVINRAAAKRFWPDGAVGKEFLPWAGLKASIVGVVDDLPASNNPVVRPEMFIPYPFLSSATSLIFAIHVTEDTRQVREGIQAALKAIWPGAGVPAVYPITDQVERSRLNVKLAVRVAFIIACIAAVVIGFGLYFFSAYSAAQTLRQSAIRLAIGASPRRVLIEHLLHYRWALLAGTILGVGLLVSVQSLSDLVSVKNLIAGVQYSMVAVGFVLAVALIGLCIPLRVVYQMAVYRILSRAD